MCRSAEDTDRMKYTEEDLAIDLHAELKRRFISTPASIFIEGAGVHWHCTAQRNDSICSIACFSALGPEYYTEFNRNSTRVATARISSREQTVDAVSDWLDGCVLSDLHGKFSFVDKDKRALKQLLEDVLSIEPDLKSTTRFEIEHKGADIYYLQLACNERSCEISFYGKNDLPDAKFAWDDCQLFQFRPDQAAKLANVLKRWLSDRSPPSIMRNEFPWLRIGELADYYENGNPIEGEFLRSWDSIEEFYGEDWCKFSEPVLAMIHAMRSAGYDRVLRVGQSLSSMGLSRSRRHGLRSGQASLWFDFRKDRMDVHCSLNGDTLKDHPLQFTENVRLMMDALTMIAID